MTDTELLQCRKDFEARFHLMDLTRHGGPDNLHGVYKKPDTFSTWTGWKAAYLSLKAAGALT